MNHWNTLQSFEAGASHGTCKMGGADYPFDARGYGDALQSNGFPLIYQWVTGEWDKACSAEYARFLKKAIVHGSFPMLAIAAMGATRNPKVYRWACEQLEDRDQARLQSLIGIGAIYDEYGKYIEELSNAGRTDGIQQGASGDLEAGRAGSTGVSARDFAA